MNNSLAEVHPELVSEWSEKNLPLTPDDITFGSNKKVWWKGTCGHEWQTSVKARLNGEKCPICSGARVIAGINDLATLEPLLAKQWSKKNKIKPTEVSIGSHKKVIWRCKKGHEWEAVVKSRTINKTGCPYCSHNKVLAGFNDLATLLPDIAAEWSDRNYPLLPTQVKVSNREEYIWYLEKTLEHKWSVDDLTSQVKSQLYERQAVANKISNFERRLPAEQKDMVLSTMKDPYMFDFIDYTEEMLETDIENELVKNVTSLLMELGTGFAFMGQQYHLEVGGKDFYIDLLFYNTKLRCYVAIDLKTGEFKPEQAGKMNFYLSALDDLVKAPEDNPSVGLILCRDENRTIAEYALRDMSKPIGVSEYHLCTDLPLDLKDALPAVEDIRSRIDMKK